MKYRFRFTGNPFVDAGIAGICAAARVPSIAALDEQAINSAAQELIRIMTDKAAFQARQIGKKPTMFATSEMSVIFPNGIHSNSSGKPSEKPTRYAARIEQKKREVLSDHPIDIGTCSVDGNVASFLVGNDEFPLVDSKSKVNFHPGHNAGRSVSAATAFALEFFPLSVLRTGINEGYYWFIHTADEEVAIACANLTRDRMIKSIALNAGMGFYGEWDIATKDKNAALIALIRDIAGGGNRTLLKKSRFQLSNFPITAYIFSNDNRGAQIKAYNLPHALFRFFSSLKGTERGQSRFASEILKNENVAWKVASRMMQREPIARSCSCIVDGKLAPSLLGGWEVHSLYASEVLKMSGCYIQVIETVSQRVTTSEDSKEAVLILRKEKPMTSLQWLCRAGLMSSTEYQVLAPPNELENGVAACAFAARDYILAAVFERQNAERQKDIFRQWPGEANSKIEQKHSLVILAEKIGTATMESGRGKRIATALARARRSIELRVEFLHMVNTGCVTWLEFVRLFPPDEEERPPAFLVRDYVLAYLYEGLRSRQTDNKELGEEDE